MHTCALRAGSFLIQIFFPLRFLLWPNPRQAAMIFVKSITHLPMLLFYPPRMKKPPGGSKMPPVRRRA
jgi:hypothetical protein